MSEIVKAVKEGPQINVREWAVRQAGALAEMIEPTASFERMCEISNIIAPSLQSVFNHRPEEMSRPAILSSTDHVTGISLTLGWPDGSTSTEMVSPRVAKMLGWKGGNHA